MENLLTVLVVLVLAALGFTALKKKPNLDDSAGEKRREELDKQIQDLGKALEKTDVKKDPVDVEEYWRKQ